MTNRIQALLDQRNLTLEQLAQRMGTTAATISRLKNGQRELTLTWLRRFSEALGCRVKDLIDEEPGPGETVAVVGYVGAGEVVENFEDPGGGLEQTPAPPHGAPLSAVIVRGESMHPRYESGDLLYFEPVNFVSDDALGRAAIVQLKAGPTYVKRLLKGTRPGFFKLLSHQGPDISDVEVAWASPVRWVKQA